MDFRVIPTVTLQQTPIALPSYGTLANTAPVPSQQQLSVAAANAPIRYTYGTDRLGLQIINALLDASGNLLLDCLIGEGTIGGVTSVEVNDDTVAGVTVTAYDGTQTTANSELVAAWLLQGVVYTDVRPGIAYCVIKIAASTDVPIDSRSIVTVLQGLKVYDPRQNLLLHSEALDNAIWTKSHCTIVANAAAAPDGSMTADQVVDDVSVGNQHFPWQGINATAGQPYVAAWYFKAGSFRYACMQFSDFVASYVAATFDLQTGSITEAVHVAGTPAWTAINGGISDAGGGWYRCWLEGVLPVGRTAAYALVLLSNTPTGTSGSAYTSTGAGNIYAWGASVRHATASADGYVKTAASVFNPVTQYSNNPALALANFLADPVKGYGDTVDWNSVGIAAARCDEQLAGTARHACKITFDRQVKKKDIEETLRGAAGCFVVREGGTTYLVPDAPVDTSGTLHLLAADWDTASLRYSQREAGRAPNRIAVRYTSTAVKPWAEAYTDYIESADVTAGLVDAVEMVVNATWITSYAEAIRLRNRYYAEHQLGLKGLEFEVFEKGWKIRRGDVIRLTNDVDLAAKAVRVQEVRSLGFAKLKITAQEYHAAMYSDDAPAAPTVPSSTLPSPRTVLPVTALAMVEEVYLDQSQSALVASGAKYVSRFRITWTRSADRYLLDTVVKFVNGATTIFEGPTVGAEYVSPPVQQGQTYSVQVQARNVLGFLAATVSASAIAQGKLLVPGNVPRISQAIELGGEVLLAWDAAVDIDIIRYEWRYTPNTTSGSWESATFIDRVDSLRARFKGLPVGTHRFYVKAIDSVPQYSATAAYVDITITSDANAFLQALEFISPTLTSMIAHRVEGETWSRWITAFADTWSTLFPSAMSTYTNPIASYHTAGTSKFVGESQDVGSLITGAWSLSASVTALSGSVTYSIETSPDNAVWTPQSGISYTGAARYVRPVIETTGAMEILRPPVITLAAVTRKESGGPVTSSAGAATTISLSGKYAKAVRITITPLGTAARIATLNNVVLSTSGANSFDVYLFDAAGTQVASSFNWDHEGF